MVRPRHQIAFYQQDVILNIYIYIEGEGEGSEGACVIDGKWTASLLAVDYKLVDLSRVYIFLCFRFCSFVFCFFSLFPAALCVCFLRNLSVCAIFLTPSGRWFVYLYRRPLISVLQSKRGLNNPYTKRSMDGKKKMGSSSSSSSFTSDLFGSNDSFGSGIFGSIFAPSSKVLGRESSRYEVPGKRQDSTSQVWGSKPGTQGTVPRSSGGENLSMLNGETSPFYQEQRVQPCHLSSSIYYGGQDIYANSQNPQGSVYSTFNKDWTEDDSGSASRGNWWQGSLYY